MHSSTLPKTEGKENRSSSNPIYHSQTNQVIMNRILPQNNRNISYNIDIFVFNAYSKKKENRNQQHRTFM